MKITCILLSIIAINCLNENIINSDNKIEILNISLQSNCDTMFVEWSEEFIIDIEPTNANKKNIKWSSSDTSIATVTDSGEVHARKIGETIITVQADSNGVSDQCHLIVLRDPRPFVNEAEFMSLTDSALIRNIYPEDMFLLVAGKSYPEKKIGYTQITEGQKHLFTFLALYCHNSDDYPNEKGWYKFWNNYCGLHAEYGFDDDIISALEFIDATIVKENFQNSKYVFYSNKSDEEKKRLFEELDLIYLENRQEILKIAGKFIKDNTELFVRFKI